MSTRAWDQPNHLLYQLRSASLSQIKRVIERSRDTPTPENVVQAKSLVAAFAQLLPYIIMHRHERSR